MSTSGRRPGHLLADIEHGALVHLAFADHYPALDMHLAQLVSHGIHGGLVGGLLVAPAPEPRRRDGGRFGDTRHLQHQHAI
jgi:hypothetical protein